MNNINSKSLPIAICIAAALSSSAFAATETAELNVSANVIDNCLISTDALVFGNYDSVDVNLADDLEGEGAVNVTCTLGDITTVTLSQGATPAGGSTEAAPARQMASGTNRLAYFLYSDEPRTTAWGNTALTGVEHEGTGTEVALTVYGSVPAGQNRPAGAYSDVVVATVEF